MVRFAMWSLLFALCACQTGKPSVATDVGAQAATPQDAPADSLFLLPGPFSQRTTVVDLETRFGKSNVQISEARNDDGTLERSVVLFPEDPTRRAFVGFHDAENLSDLQSISVRDA
ncbi:MAG TPA: hypothetical protein VGD21_06255, partial [Lysobacter sp.]